jgi:hypothetical protein
MARQQVRADGPRHCAPDDRRCCDGRITHIREIMDTFDLVQQVLERDVAADLTEKTPGEI